MIRRRVAIALALAVLVSATWSGAVQRAELPARLTDQEFWKLSEQLSEPNGSFRSDNLLSNEAGLQYVIPDLLARLGQGGVYMGVGPEQNFTYIAALKPKVAFIVDVRRGNRDLHLMYKALFEMAADRADFLALLFSRRRPEGLSTSSTVGEIFAAYEAAQPDSDYYRQNSAKIRDLLVKTHGLPLTDEEVQGVQYVYDNFFQFGPGINYSSSTSGRGGGPGTYSTLMSRTDLVGEARSYLATEAHFNVLKDLEARNMLVPVVGNFAGPKAIRAVGAWIKERGAIVSAFYLSNVESYLGRDGLGPTFCQNVATLPFDDKSTLIRSGPSVFVRPPPPPPPDPAGSAGSTGTSGTVVTGGTTTTTTSGAFGSFVFITRSGSNTLTAQIGGRGNQLALIADEVKACSPPQPVGK
jgi:hypothetical protein